MIATPVTVSGPHVEYPWPLLLHTLTLTYCSHACWLPCPVESTGSRMDPGPSFGILAIPGQQPLQPIQFFFIRHFFITSAGVNISIPGICLYRAATKAGSKVPFIRQELFDVPAFFPFFFPQVGAPTAIDFASDEAVVRTPFFMNRKVYCGLPLLQGAHLHFLDDEMKVAAVLKVPHEILPRRLY